jgi:hypothetical protein
VKPLAAFASLIAVTLACRSASPPPARAQAPEVTKPPQAAIEPSSEPAREPEREPQPEVWHAGQGVDVVRSVNATSNTHGVGRPELYRAVVGLYVRDAARHTVVVDHLALVVDTCGPPRRDDALGAREVVPKRESIAIRDVRLTETLGSDKVRASGTRIQLPTGFPAAYDLLLSFDTKRLGETCGKIAFEAGLAIDGARFEVPLPIGIPHDIPRHDPLSKPF